MLFNSYLFIFIYLPIVIAGYYVIGCRGYHKAAIIWLIVASLLFYAWWNPPYVLLLLFSICFNYFFGAWVSPESIDKKQQSRKLRLILGIAVNLSILAYFKYANFFVDNLNDLSGSDFHLTTIVLPLAISFFTFQQIAFLLDAYRGNIQSNDFVSYCLFVSFFPQLISGPIVHHKEMMPQFVNQEKTKQIRDNISVGLAFFTIGLFKKVVIADGMAQIADPVFQSVATYGAVSTSTAWWALLAYAFQIYFDFSAYSDMAVGLARMFGINLPLNFNSPYKSANFFELWSRWHMTFTRFMRNHVYIPLVRNRKIAIGHQLGLVISVLLGGLWHGANWTYIVWASLHASFMLCNHYWHLFRRYLGHDMVKRTISGTAAAIVLTFSLGMFTRVFFRADSIESANIMTRAMIGLQESGSILPVYYELNISIYHLMSFLLLFILVWFLPNSQQWFAKYQVGIDPSVSGRKKRYSGSMKEFNWPSFQISPSWAVFIAVLLTISLMNIPNTQEFIYYQF